MPTIRNIAVTGLSGAIGDLVYRQLNGKTVVSRKSTAPASNTPAQQKQRSAFRDANAYAKSAMQDPATKQFYQSKAREGCNAHNMAVQDFFHPPVIQTLNSSGYDGSAGSHLEVLPFSEYGRIVSVHFTIEGADGSLVETGPAVQAGDGLNWIYTATVANSSLAGTIIKVTASDTVPHATSKQFNL